MEDLKLYRKSTGFDIVKIMGGHRIKYTND